MRRTVVPMILLLAWALHMAPAAVEGVQVCNARIFSTLRVIACMYYGEHAISYPAKEYIWYYSPPHWPGRPQEFAWAANNYVCTRFVACVDLAHGSLIASPHGECYSVFADDTDKFPG